MVALYACSDFSKVEIGKYGMPLEEAKKHFLTKVEKNGLMPWKVDETNDKVSVKFQLGDGSTCEKLENLITDFAKVSILHRMPPTKYFLVKEQLVNSGEYLQTNCYSG